MGNITNELGPLHDLFEQVADDVVALFGLTCDAFLDSSLDEDPESLDFLVKVQSLVYNLS